MFVNSNSIKVFPTSKRNDEKDRHARLTTEYNISNIVNRLTSRDSFVIDGCEVTGSTLGQGSFNIHGYYFEITDAQGIALKNSTNTDLVPTEGDVLYLSIKLDTIDSSFVELTKMSSSTNQATLDTSDDKFIGLEITVGNKTSTEPYNSGNIYYLPIAKAVADGSSFIWKDIPTTRLKYNASDICVSFKNEIGTGDAADAIKIGGGLTTDTVDTVKSLYDWLNNSFTIDDGII